MSFLQLNCKSPEKSEGDSMKSCWAALDAMTLLLIPFLRRLRGPVAQALALLMLCAAYSVAAPAQERAYFITYNHQMEEPGSLEISMNPVFGTQRGAGNFLASWTEFEYGAKGWWTTEFYLDSQTTRHDSTVFTGFRWENRFRPFLREHWINPVLYVEFEDINGADKTLLEVVGHDRSRRRVDLPFPTTFCWAAATIGFRSSKSAGPTSDFPCWRFASKKTAQLKPFARFLSLSAERITALLLRFSCGARHSQPRGRSFERTESGTPIFAMKSKQCTLNAWN